MMGAGKWYLLYPANIGGTVEQYKVPLEATTVDEALAEAKMKWGGQIAAARAFFKKIQNDPNTTQQSHIYGPCIAYEIPF